MVGPKTISRHEMLATRMAETIGRDPSDLDAADMGQMRDRREAILRCTSCTDPDACAAWLDSHEHADRPPAYCRNNLWFATLAKA